MRSLCSIQQDLRRNNKSQRRKILEQEVRTMNENEKERYRKLYEMAHMGLKTRKTVSLVIREMDRAGLFFQSASYFPLEYALACIVTGNPVQEPIQVVREAWRKKPYVTKNVCIPPIFDRLVSPNFSKRKSHSSEEDYE